MNQKRALRQTRSFRHLAVILAVVCALLVPLRLSSAAYAAPLGHPELSRLTNLASSVDSAAKGGDWNGASRQYTELVKQWSAKRTPLGKEIRLTAQTQSLDASMKWMQTAIGKRDIRNVHQAALRIAKAIHEAQEMPPARH